MAASPCLSDFSEIEFSRIVELFEMSFTHKHSCHKGKLFFPMLCFEKTMEWNTTLKKRVDFLLFKCNFNVPNFTIVALDQLPNKAAENPRKASVSDNVFLEAER